MKQFWLYVFLFLTLGVWSQETVPVNEMYIMAREEAFEHKNYDKAIGFMEEVVKKAPENVDYAIFLGRLYTWDKQTDNARRVLGATFKSNSEYEDAALAYASLEFWNQNSEKALEIVDKGLQSHPDSENLLVLKAKILMDLKRGQEASKTLNTALKYHPKSTNVRSLLQNMATGENLNEVGISYNFVDFKERFDQPWHLASLHYGRQTGIGPVFGRLNYGNRFGIGSTQFEVDFYPRISKTFYAYINGGISNDKAIFPQYRAGFSLYANVPAAFEVDAGFRMLQFDEASWTYTFGLGKYYKNYWFNLRTYLNTVDAEIADAYALTARYYFGGADDYFSARVGTGFSPDNTSNNVLFNNTARLRSTNFALGYRNLLGQTHVVYVEASYDRIEFASDTFDDQYTVKLGYIKRF
ncbi:YaiO family outer membrane beta-barrel protein [Flagellimonas marinaquae]|uniref:YaiO family outer membrane beta-barrel protein n=1 Tax=Flagellimonas aurea TaxID=2915619 RepID=UPI001CE17F6A|nr:YaiO family outer membrane beta-barrel protein [Allomuricauda aquimarina]